MSIGDKVFRSAIMVIVIGALVGSSAFAWWVNGLLIAALIAALIYVWTH